MFLRILKVSVFALSVAGAAAEAHDPSAYGGLFRTRDFGGVWLNADVGLFLGGAVSLAVNPADPNHLLLGTDTNLLVTRNGGRDWKQEAPNKLFGAVFAVAFLADGKTALCSTPAGVFRFEAGEWQQVVAPAEAAPSRAIVSGATPERVYLAGRRDLYRSEDRGRSWSKVEHGLPDQPEFSLLAAMVQPPEILYAIADGRVLMSSDRGQGWQERNAGLPAGVEALSIDHAATGRLWAAAADRVYRSDDGGVRWKAVGQALPEPGTSVRAIAADASATKLVLTTHRGMFRSVDGGETWGLLEGNLPVHLEARPLVRDPTHADTLYAGYALMPYSEIWRIAVEGGNLLGRVDVFSLAGGFAFLLLLGLAGVLFARRLAARNGGSKTPLHNSGKWIP
ncbi:MAG TPA: hypothetical protein VGR01_11225 [Burkholderiales bacterium]|nr:hypothetical protein [Burkholderiales bacterium]